MKTTLFVAGVSALLGIACASGPTEETVIVRATGTKTAVLVMPSGRESEADVVLVDELDEYLKKMNVQLEARAEGDDNSTSVSSDVGGGVSSTQDGASSAVTSTPISSFVASSTPGASSAVESTTSQQVSSARSSAAPSTTETEASSTRESVASSTARSAQTSTTDAETSSAGDSTAQTIETVTQGGTTVTSVVVNTITTSSAESTSTGESTSSDVETSSTPTSSAESSSSSSESSATSAAASGTTAASSATPSGATGEEDDSSGGGLSAHDRNIVIGVVVGIGGALILAGLGYVAWRVWGRKGPRTPAATGENKTSLDNDPFRQNIDQYHSSAAAPRVNNPAANF